MAQAKIARLTQDQLSQIEQLENKLGVTLVAYEPPAADHDQAKQANERNQ